MSPIDKAIEFTLDEPQNLNLFQHFIVADVKPSLLKPKCRIMTFIAKLKRLCKLLVTPFLHDLSVMFANTTFNTQSQG